MNVTCPACSSKYAVPDEKVLGKKVRIRCKRCGESILVDGTTEASAPSASGAARVAATGSATAGARTPVAAPMSPVSANPSTMSAGDPSSAPVSATPGRAVAQRANLKRTMLGGLQPAAGSAPTPVGGSSGAAASGAAARQASVGVAAPPPPTVTPTPAPAVSTAPSQVELEAAIEWTVAFDEERQETRTTAEIVELYRTAQIAPDTFIWREGMDTWSTPLEIPEIRRALDASGQSHRLSAPPGADEVQAPPPSNPPPVARPPSVRPASARPPLRSAPPSAAALPSSAGPNAAGPLAAGPASAEAAQSVAEPSSKLPSQPPPPPEAPAPASLRSARSRPPLSSAVIREKGPTWPFSAAPQAPSSSPTNSEPAPPSQGEAPLEPKPTAFSPFTAELHESLPPADRTGAEPLVPMPQTEEPAVVSSQPPSHNGQPESLHKISLAPARPRSRPWLIVALLLVLVVLGIVAVRLFKQPEAAWKLYERYVTPVEHRVLGK